MNSEQAMWTKTFIMHNVNKQFLLEGYTYLFECVYSDNTLVVKYPFQGNFSNQIGSSTGSVI